MLALDKRRVLLTYAAGLASLVTWAMLLGPLLTVPEIAKIEIRDGAEDEFAPRKGRSMTTSREWAIDGKDVEGFVKKDTDELFFASSEAPEYFRPVQKSAFSERNQDFLDWHYTGIAHGTVIAILDGDTLDLLTNHKYRIRIRLHGIDAPEKSQAHGQKAKAKLSELAYLKSFVATRRSINSGRYVATMIDQTTGEILQQQMVESGYAWHAPEYSRSEILAQAEQQARAARAGLWQDIDPIAPWDYRKGRRTGDDRFELDRWASNLSDRFYHPASVFQPIGEEMWTRHPSHTLVMHRERETRHHDECRHFHGGDAKNYVVCKPNEGTPCGTCKGMELRTPPVKSPTQ